MSRPTLRQGGTAVLRLALGVLLLAWVLKQAPLDELLAVGAQSLTRPAGWLAGIGFTMSLFIASSAFDDPALLDLAKMDILFASVLAAAIGFTLITITSPRQEGVSVLPESAGSAQSL